MSTTVQPAALHAAPAKQAHANEMADRILAASLDKVIAALPNAVSQAMQTAIPERYSPELAAEFAEDMIGRLRAPQTPCPDGIRWCIGDPTNHADADTRDHRHEGPEYQLSGSYLQDPDGDSIAAFHLASWGDTGPRFVFQGTGLWPDMGLDQVDELKSDVVPWTVALFAVRRRFAIELNPGRTAFTESEDEQMSSAAFELATAAMTVALEKTTDRTAMLAAMRAWVKLTEAEDLG